jgi:uncharacterized protein YyaL (SSP411 family)
MPNHLSGETSPYLLQHANNPVDWYPWGEEAFRRATAEDKPVLLSIGYSACHWCHVMAHESFENSEIAALMNENFVCIKVDREEHPDIDHVYMESVQAISGGGGWPLTVFLTPDGKPFYGGTYFPPEDSRGIPGFPRILRSVVEAYHNRRSSIDETTSQIAGFLTGLITAPGSPAALTKAILEEACASLEGCFDSQNGGFGGAPKFPNPLTLDFLLKYYSFAGEKKALEMVDMTLDKMAGGGIYDQIGGGFHRYSTDSRWLVPHFEKMLYDNALLSRVYLHSYLITGNKSRAAVTQETLDYVLREMTDARGGFFCSQDADTEGQEGKYYLWTRQEIREELGEHLASKIEDYYGVTGVGNFAGLNILHRAGFNGLSAEMQDARSRLLKRRDRRTRPGRDEKVLASWNGLMLAGLAEAAAVFQRQDYLAAAVNSGNFLEEAMIVAGGRLMHSYTNGTVKIEAFLEDYANIIEGFLSLHQTTLDIKWLKLAVELVRMMIEEYYDAESGILYDTPARQEANLFVRPRNDFDGASPSGTAAATLVLLKMAVLTGNTEYSEIARKNLSSVSQRMAKTPMGYSQWLCALEFHLAPQPEIVLVGNKNDPRTKAMATIISSRWLPDKIWATLDPASSDSLNDLPLFKDRPALNGEPTVYICVNNTCRAPIPDGARLAEELGSL